MNWFWHAMWIGLVLIPVTILWLGCILDVFRRHDLHPVGQVLWVLAILVLPVFGALTYLVLRPRHVGAFAEGAVDRQPLSQQMPVSQQLADLDRLHTTGAIDDREFEVAKEDALARVPSPRGANAGFSTGAATAPRAGSGR